MKKGLITAVLGWIAAANAAAARSLGQMADKAKSDLAIMTGFFEIAFYLLGALVVVYGLFRAKKHVEQPQQVSLWSAVIAILVGGAVVAVPPIVNAIGESFGVAPGSRMSLPR